MVSNVWEETTHPFPNVDGTNVEVLELISNFITPFLMYVITYT